MMQAEKLITEHLDLWTSAVKPKAAAGRGRGKGSSNKRELYGLKKLRELILELAVRGQLVPQDPNDEPTSVLLERIAAEKARLIAEKKIKKQKALPPIVDNDKPFELPPGWEWGYLGEIGIVASSRRVLQKDWQGSGIPFYRAREIVKLSQVGAVNNSLFISKELFLSFKSKGFVPEIDDIMLTGVGTIGVPYVVQSNEGFYFKDASVLIFKNVFSLYPWYLCYFMKSPLWNRHIHKNSMGTTVHTLTIQRSNQVLVPIPPLAEQKRIVTKVNELMQLCDQLEQTTEANLDAHQTLVENLLSTLTNASDYASFQSAWQRIAAHFDSLFTTEHSIDQLKQTILQLAVMGKLVPQDPNDEPASVLLEKIAAEKARLVKEKKIKKQKALPPIGEEEKPFDLPEGWEWCQLQSLVTILGDGLHGTPSYDEAGDYFFVNGNNLNDGVIAIKPETKRVNKEEYLKHRKELTSRTVFVSINGTLGNVAFYDSEPVILGKSACYFNLGSNIYKLFIKYLIESPYFLDYALEKATGSTIKNLGLKAMNSFPIALPSLAEQKRIVAKVNELMTLCDQLKARLNTSQQTQWQLADAITSEVSS
jgi:type I restriction enzyme S subunit